jgi:hypothetical protein
MSLIVLVHWNAEEAADLAAGLRAPGRDVLVHSSQMERLNWGAESPAALVVSLARLPSHGREIAEAFLAAKSRRHIPVLFVGGAADKVAVAKGQFPDCEFSSVDEAPRRLTELLAKPQAARKSAKSAPPPSPAGYSGTPLVKKLGVKPDARLYVLNAPENYWAMLGELPRNATEVKRAVKGVEFVHFFATNRRDLEREFPRLQASLAADGRLWVSWPKKTSGVTTDLDETVVRETGLRHGLVDVKVCAVDAVWSGRLFVFRAADRPKAK